MNLFTALGIVLTGLFFNTGCVKSENDNNKTLLEEGACLRGLLVKKGICGQRVIKILSGTKEGLTYAAQWTDESSGKQFENVFTVENSCSFPASLKGGDEFNFKLTTDKSNDCILCQAYTPVPNEKNKIVVTADCNGQGNKLHSITNGNWHKRTFFFIKNEYWLP